VPGYQKVGVVEGVGKDVRDFREGDWVFGTISAVEGMFYATGGHVSPAVTHQSQVWKLPRPVSPLAVSGLVLTQVGCNCGMRPALQSGDRAVVIGDGLVGHWSAQTLAYRGARVMLVGRRQERLSLFETGDEGRRVNSRKDDPLTMAREWAPEGVQVLVDTVGSIAAVEAFYPVLRHDAHIVSAGFYGANGKIDIQAMRLRELTLHTPSGWSKARMDTTLDLIEKGVLKTEPLITHRFRAQDAVEAYSLILFPREPALGIVLDWQE
jgi:2-desacetyl-2-hydroxyethyl bacteriochlorophyllide A dehydrogenase